MERGRSLSEKGPGGQEEIGARLGRHWGAGRVELDWPAGGTIMTRLYRWAKVAVCMFALSGGECPGEKRAIGGGAEQERNARQSDHTHVRIPGV